jgi:dolichol-phosphate mannosyltransferase
MFLSVILPTYNERRNLPILVHMLVEELSKPTKLHGRFEIVIVDDSSPDGTGAVALKLAEAYGPDVVQVRARPGKLGLGTAYRHGLQFCRGDWVVLMDVDLSHHPKFIRSMIQRQRDTEADIVTGSRYIAGGGVHGWTFSRKLVSRSANLLATLALWPQVSDLTGAFRLYRRTVLSTLIGECQTKGYPFQMELMVRARALGFVIAEVPITFVDRVYGESKLSSGEIVGYLRGIWTLMLYC